MKQDIAHLLKKKGYYPLDSPLWSSFQFPLEETKLEKEKIANIKRIESLLSSTRGIYVYFSSNNVPLYVGKGSPIKSRLISHYRKVFEGKSVKLRIAFFQSIKGTVTIYWLEIKDKDERELVEHLLSYVLSPKYKKWRPI